jgi:hypothetical protein
VKVVSTVEGGGGLLLLLFLEQAMGRIKTRKIFFKKFQSFAACYDV